MRSGRGSREEFSAFYASAYPELVAQLLAITGDARIARTATEATLAKAWRTWPSLRQAADPLMRARWTAVNVAAEQATADGTPAAAEELTGDAEDAVVVAALQQLPAVQRRALVLHYMGGVTVNDLAALSGSSAEHIELLLDDGFTALAESLDWADEIPDATLEDGDETAEDDLPDSLDLRFDWTAEALADTAARLPDEITAPSPAAMLRRAALVRWSTRAAPVAACAACVAVALIVAAQPGTPADRTRPAIYAQNDDVLGVAAPPQDTAPDPATSAGPATATHTAPVVRMRSVALTSLLDPYSDPGYSTTSTDYGSSQSSSSGSSSSGSSSSGSSSSGSSSSGSSSSGSSSSGSSAAGGASGGGSTGSGATGTTTPPTTTPTGTTTPATTTPSTTTPSTTTPSTTTSSTTNTTPPTTTVPTTTVPTTTTQPVTTDPTTTTQPVSTTPPVRTTSAVPKTTIITPTSVIETSVGTTIEKTTVTTTTTTADTTTADTTTADTTTADTSTAKSGS